MPQVENSQWVTLMNNTKNLLHVFLYQECLPLFQFMLISPLLEVYVDWGQVHTLNTIKHKSWVVIRVLACFSSPLSVLFLSLSLSIYMYIYSLSTHTHSHPTYTVCECMFCLKGQNEEKNPEKTGKNMARE